MKMHHMSRPKHLTAAIVGIGFDPQSPARSFEGRGAQGGGNRYLEDMAMGKH